MFRIVLETPGSIIPNTAAALPIPTGKQLIDSVARRAAIRWPTARQTRVRIRDNEAIVSRVELAIDQTGRNKPPVVSGSTPAAETGSLG